MVFRGDSGEKRAGVKQPPEALISGPRKIDERHFPHHDHGQCAVSRWAVGIAVVSRGAHRIAGWVRRAGNFASILRWMSVFAGNQWRLLRRPFAATNSAIYAVSARLPLRFHRQLVRRREIVGLALTLGRGPAVWGAGSGRPSSPGLVLVDPALGAPCRSNFGVGISARHFREFGAFCGSDPGVALTDLELQSNSALDAGDCTGGRPILGLFQSRIPLGRHSGGKSPSCPPLRGLPGVETAEIQQRPVRASMPRYAVPLPF